LNSKEIIARYYISFQTLVIREIKRFMLIGVQTLVAPFISNILFLGIFAGFFAGHGDKTVKGFDYISFITPGLIFSAVVSSAYQNPVFSIIMMKYQDTIKEFNYFPMKPLGRLGGFVIAGALRGFLVGIMTYFAAGLFSGYSIAHPVFFWLAVALVSLILSLAGYLTGIYMYSVEKSNFIVILILSPLVYLGGVFFNIETLPGIFRQIGFYNPFAVMISYTRYVYIGSGSLPGLFPSMMTLLLILILFAVSYRATVKGIGIKIK